VASEPPIKNKYVIHIEFREVNPSPIIKQIFKIGPPPIPAD
jgi:hypothetical protein